MKLRILFLFLVLNVGALASNLGIDDFLQCLQSNSKSTTPISEAIFTPQHPSFLTVLQAYIRNSRFNTSSTPKPLVIVTPFDVSHVQVTVVCAKENRLEIRIRSGGHDYEGLSYVSHVPFVLLDMVNLRSIDIDLPSETATVQSGAILGELYYEIAKASNIHGFPAGICPTVGVGGHFGGGGYGTLLRKFGLSIDNIIDVVVVNANGEVLNRQTMGEDLFWAIRGGGAGSFCVVVSWKIKLVRVPEKVTVFNVQRTLEDGATDVAIQWQQVAPIIDRNLFIRVESQVDGLFGEGKTIRVSFIGMYLGRATNLLSLINNEFPLLGLRASDCIETSWVRSQLFWSRIDHNGPLEALLERTPSSPYNFQKTKSDYITTHIPKQALETIWHKMMELEIVLLQWNPYGGRMSEIAADATAFPHRRGHLFMMLYISHWPEDTVQALTSNIDTSRQVHALFTPYASSNPRQAFLNYRDIDVGTNENGNLTFASQYYNGNVQRLLQVKHKVDPTNFFHYEQSIPSFFSRCAPKK